MNALRCACLGVAIFALAGCAAGDAPKDASASYASVPVFAGSTTSEAAKQYAEEGDRADDSGRAIKAYEAFKSAVAADSAWAYGYLRLAQTSQSQAEFLANYERAVAFKGTANEIERLLIEIAEKNFARDQESALELAKQLVAKESSNPRAYWVLWNAESNVGHEKEARAALEKAAELAPTHGAAQTYAGAEYIFDPDKDLVKAERYIQKGVDLWPQEPVTWDYLGDLRRAQGRFEEAAQAYAKMIELDPEPADQYSQIGHVNTFLGKYDEARKNYDDAIRRSKANQPAVYAGFKTHVSLFAGKPEDAMAEIRQLVDAIDGMNIPEPEGLKINWLTNLAITAGHYGKFDVAENAQKERTALMRARAERIGTADEKRGAEAGIVIQDANLAFFKGDYATAASKAQEYMKLREPDRNPTKNRPAHATFGFVAFKQKKFEEAIQHFDESDLTNMYVLFHKGLALEGLGRTDEAKKIFTEVANYNFNNLGAALTRRDAQAKLQ